MSPAELAALAKRSARELGFVACGITDLAPSTAGPALSEWLASGLHGDMRYMARQETTRREPGRAWPEALSIVVVLDSYYCEQAVFHGDYRIARYAQGFDYHAITSRKLDGVGEALVAAAGHGSWRAYVDAGPLPERELARRAGLGWVGKNTMLIHPKLGSFTFIGCLLTDLRLATDGPFEADRCGTCTRCLDACPTGAFPAPRVLDARRCVSYLTIESRGPIPDALRPGVGDNLYGCDICQDVCPWNVRFAQASAEPAFAPRPAADWPTLDGILRLDGAAFDARFAPTPLERAGLAGLQRNAQVVKENRLARG
jgi:epoxyqueuosine reductase